MLKLRFSDFLYYNCKKEKRLVFNVDYFSKNILESRTLDKTSFQFCLLKLKSFQSDLELVERSY